MLQTEVRQETCVIVNNMNVINNGIIAIFEKHKKKQIKSILPRNTQMQLLLLHVPLSRGFFLYRNLGAVESAGNLSKQLAHIFLQ